MNRNELAVRKMKDATIRRNRDHFGKTLVRVAVSVNIVVWLFGILAIVCAVVSFLPDFRAEGMESSRQAFIYGAVFCAVVAIGWWFYDHRSDV